MKEILELVIKNLVDNKDEVSINERTNDDKSTSYEVKVAKDDIGKIIGKQGKMAKSIRTIMKAVAVKEHKKIIIEFLD
ncbi:MAG: KH domain-containing protein [Clostridia bacterium]|nr:KH domain-containing protein [Clostridia bacterium]